MSFRSGSRAAHRGTIQDTDRKRPSQIPPGGDGSRVITSYSIHYTKLYEPIVIKHAPKDTAEAAAPETVPDTVMNKPVFLLFELDNAVLLSFRQAGTRVNGFHLKKGLLNSQIAMKRIQSTIQGIPAKNKRNYHPAITIDINARNAETSYNFV